MGVDAEWMFIDPFLAKVDTAEIGLLFRSKKLRRHNDKIRFRLAPQAADFYQRCEAGPLAAGPFGRHGNIERFVF